MAATFHLEVVTPEAQVVDTEALEVIFPLHDGQVGILAHHSPLLGKVSAGPLTVKTPASSEVYFVHGGFAQMKGNRLTLLVEEATPKDQIDAEAARKQLEAAHAMPGLNAEDMERREDQLSQARAKLAMVE